MKQWKNTEVKNIYLNVIINCMYLSNSNIVWYVVNISLHVAKKNSLLHKSMFLSLRHQSIDLGCCNCNYLYCKIKIVIILVTWRSQDLLSSIMMNNKFMPSLDCHQ